MKSRPQYVEVAPCSCKNKCPCHQPRKKNWKYKLKLIIMSILGISVLPVFAFYIEWYARHHTPAVRPIEVNGQMCEIKFKVTHHSSTGAARGHDMAVCK